MNLHKVLTGRMRRMHHIQRYSSIPVINRENVAAHSWELTFYAMLIGVDMKENRYIEVDYALLMFKGINHDVSEVLSGDIIRSYKHSNPTILRACQTTDRTNMVELANDIGGSPGMAVSFYWETAKNESIEGAIVRFCDMLCVVAYCVEEMQMGNTHIEYILREVYEEHLRPYHNDQRFAPYMYSLYPNCAWRDPLDGSVT